MLHWNPLVSLSSVEKKQNAMFKCHMCYVLWFQVLHFFAENCPQTVLHISLTWCLLIWPVWDICEWNEALNTVYIFRYYHAIYAFHCVFTGICLQTLSQISLMEFLQIWPICFTCKWNEAHCSRTLNGWKT